MCPLFFENQTNPIADKNLWQFQIVFSYLLKHEKHFEYALLKNFNEWTYPVVARSQSVTVMLYLLFT